MWAQLIGDLPDSTMFSGVSVNESDTLLTLSTCTRQLGSSSEQRFVVVARLLRDGETDSDAVKYAVNADAKEPKL